MADTEGQMTVGVYVIFSDMLAVEVRQILSNAEAVSELSYKWQGNILVKELHMEETMTYTPNDCCRQYKPAPHSAFD